MALLKCSCGKTGRYKKGDNVWTREKKTGFHMIMMSDTSTVWLCEDCYNKVNEHAIEIVKIVESQHIYFPHLLR